MAEDDRTFHTSTPQANRAEQQGLGVGQKELNAQRVAQSDQQATDPERLEPFDNNAAGGDRGPDSKKGGSSDMGAGSASRGPGDGAQMRGVAQGDGGGSDGTEGSRVQGEGRAFDDRNAAGIGDAGDLGAGTPAGVDIHDLGQADKPQQAWGEDGGEDMLHSSSGSRRGVKTEAERGQGAKTRAANKDIVSRRG
jgi:hypothetical protein